MQLRDRTTQAFIAGVVGAIVQMFFTLTLYEMGLMRLRFLDYSAVIAWGSRPDNLLQSVVAVLGVWIMAGILGVVYIQSLRVTHSKNIVMKGALYGYLYWFLINVYVTAFRVDGLYPIGFQTSILQSIGGIIYGTVTGKTYAYLANKYGLGDHEEIQKNIRISPIPQPAMKPLNQDKDDKTKE